MFVHFSLFKQAPRRCRGHTSIHYEAHDGVGVELYAGLEFGHFSVSKSGVDLQGGPKKRTPDLFLL